jgi:RND superfamily putative drug exporter
VAGLLYWLGRAAFRRRWIVVFGWVAALAVVGILAARAPAAPSDSLSMPGTESQQANDLLQKSFPTANPNGASAQLVFVAPHGQKVTAAQYQTAINQVVAEAAASPQVASSVSPLVSHEVSRDGSTAIGTVSYKVPANELTSATTNALTDAVQHGQAAGLTVEVGGTALNTTPTDKGVIISVAIAALVLLITFGSVAAAGLPLLTAGIGVGLGVAGITALAAALGLSSTTRSLGLMLGLAVGIDYALLIVSRYREQRARGQAPREAAAFAAGTAGSAVVFAGLTVIIALVGLSVVGIPVLTRMGLAAAAAVAIAVLVAVTLIPALLSFVPRAVLSRRSRRAAEPVPANDKPNMGSRWAGFVARRPVAVLLLAAAALGVIALPATHLRLGNAGNATLPTSSTQRRAYDDISQAFGPGFNGPLTVVVSTGSAGDPQTAVAAVEGKIKATPGIVAVSQPRFDAAGDVAVFTAVPASAPDSQQTTDVVQAIRAERPAIDSASHASYLVTGLTAVNIDSAAKVSSALLPYLLAVVGLAFLLLLAVFRSVLVPLKATAGFVLSLFAALGSLVAVFQWGWLGHLLGVAATGPIMSLMPIMMIGIAFGLAMDYEVFLVSRAREAYAHGEEARSAMVTGFRHSARVVVAAALIMTSVFGGFATSSQPLVKMIGLGLAVAIVCDAFVVRMTIVPAVLALLGKRAWWLPRWLDKILPHLDIEGQALEHRVAPATAGTPGTGGALEPAVPDAGKEPVTGR